MYGTKVLLGIRLNAFNQKPVGKIHRFKVYDVGRISELPIDDQILNKNFQISGSKIEQLVMRVFYMNRTTIKKVHYYYLKGFDPEIAEYVVKEQLKRLLKNKKLYHDFQLKRIDW